MSKKENPAHKWQKAPGLYFAEGHDLKQSELPVGVSPVYQALECTPDVLVADDSLGDGRIGASAQPIFRILLLLNLLFARHTLAQIDLESDEGFPISDPC